MPASTLPSITLDAPAASAFGTSPESLMPPSAITGTPVPRSAFAALYTAVSCGMPTPQTTRVVQIEPGPMPTFTACAPAFASATAASPVAMLPAITSTFG